MDNAITFDILYFLEGLAILFVLFVFGISIYEQKKLAARLSQAGITEIDQMNGIEFEQYLGLLFKKLGYKVKRTPASNDFGADLILEGEKRIVVQAKRYKNKVGIKAVQEINSAKAYYDAEEAWVVTNNFFTSPAIKLSQSTNIKLIDRYKLVDIILHSNTGA